MIGRYQLYGLMLGLGVLNALIRPVMSAVKEQGLISIVNGFNISFVIWFTVIWAIQVLVSAPYNPYRPRDRNITILASIGLLVPMATFSWLITGCIALYFRRITKSEPLVRAALAVIAFAAFRDPLASLVLKLMTTPLLNGDAALVAAFMSLWVETVERTGNFITGDNGHQLFILTGCTSYTNLSIALLGWFTITQATLGKIGRKQWLAGTIVGIAMVVINIVRLSIMGVGPEAYYFMHDGYGTVITDILMVFVTLFISLWGCEYEYKKFHLYSHI